MKRLYHYPSMIIFSLIASAALIILQLCFFVTNTLLKPDIYTEAIAKSGAPAKICEDLDTYFGYLSTPTNIPKEVFTKPITEDSITQSVNRIVIDSLEYISDPNAPKPEMQYDFAPLEKSITDYIEEYSESNKIEKDDEYYDFIDHTVETAEQQVSTRLDAILFNRIANSSAMEKIHTYLPYVRLAMFGSLGLIVLCIIIMCIINRHHPRDMTYWYGSILFTASAALLIPLFFLKQKKFFDGFFMRSEYTYAAITKLFNSMLDRAINFELIILISGILLIILTIIIHIIYLSILKRRDRQD